MNKNKHLHEDCGVGVDLARRRMAGVAGVGLIAASAATLWPLRTAQAQSAVIYTPLETLVAPITRGARLQRGRVRRVSARKHLDFQHRSSVIIKRNAIIADINDTDMVIVAIEVGHRSGIYD